MKNRKLFLRWATLVALVLAGCGISAQLGLFGAMLDADATRLTVVTIALFAVATGWTGFQAWRLDALRDAGAAPNAAKPDLKEADIASEDLPHAWNLCELLGFLGTVIGLVMMLSQFNELIAADTKDIGPFLSRAVYGLGTAFVTTIVGYVCSLLLRIQHRELVREIERLRS